MDIKKRIAYPFARRFFAGETLAEAVERKNEAGRAGMGVTLDYLGEDVTDLSEAESARAEYARAINAVSGQKKESGPDASVSVKLSHIGLCVDQKLALENALGLARLAREKGVFVWLDMEGSAHTDATVGIYRRLMDVHQGTGIALQAYLKRTHKDARSLVPDGGVVRLIKGAYNEPPEIAFQDMAAIRASFTGLMEYLFENAKYFAVATHDKSLIRKAIRLSRGKEGGFEFQMLMGMRDDMKRRLVIDGFRVVEYVPYGTDWYGYGIRRLKEKRRNALYLAQGLIGR